LFKTRIDGPDGKNFGRRRRFHNGSLCVCGIEADKAANKCQCGGRNEFNVIDSRNWKRTLAAVPRSAPASTRTRSTWSALNEIAQRENITVHDYVPPSSR
jgi:hypothetical protein